MCLPIITIIFILFLRILLLVKISCISMSDINFSEYGRRLIENISNEFLVLFFNNL